MRSQTPSTVRFDSEVRRDLKAMAKASGIPLARIVNDAVRDRVAMLALSALPDVRDAYVKDGGVMPERPARAPKPPPPPPQRRLSTEHMVIDVTCAHAVNGGVRGSAAMARFAGRRRNDVIAAIRSAIANGQICNIGSDARPRYFPCTTP